MGPAAHTQLAAADSDSYGPPLLDGCTLDRDRRAVKRRTAARLARRRPFVGHFDHLPALALRAEQCTQLRLEGAWLGLGGLATDGPLRFTDPPTMHS